MNDYHHIQISVSEDIGNIVLARNVTGNALNSEMIVEMIRALKILNDDDRVRFIHFTGKGEVFSSGADLNWMKNATGASYMLNYDDSLKLARCFYSVYSSRKITISTAHGAVYGGGNGLIAASDFSFAISDTVFSFSEVKLGLVPATIAPYVIKKIGVNRAKEFMLTGRKFSAAEAFHMGLINGHANTRDEADKLVYALIQQLREGAPEAQKAIKRLIQDVSERIIDENLQHFTAGVLTRAKNSDEGREGISSFLEKRKPSWHFLVK